MSHLQPVVLQDVSLVELVSHIIDANLDAATVVVCSDKATFMAGLSAPRPTPAGPTSALPDEPDGEDELMVTAPQPLQTVLTLRFLLATRKIKLAFCPDVPHLRAYLAALVGSQASQISSNHTSSRRILVLLNPIRLHRPTSAFSAQGFNRSFGLAVEAAHATGSRLVISECPSESPVAPTSAELGEDDMEETKTHDSTTNPWDEELSILSVTTKTFGEGERGWVGRTVKLRTVAERWCRFESWTSQTIFLVSDDLFRTNDVEQLKELNSLI